MGGPMHVLWTSGWDSTYRVADLVLHQEQVVQPWYIIDSLRRSTKTELRTIDYLRDRMIEKDSTVSKRLLRPNLIRLEDIPEDNEISMAFKELQSKATIGSQNDWLARFAKSEGLELELSIHRDDTSQAFLKGHTAIDHYGVHRLKRGAPEELRLFQYFAFPLFDLSKLDMQRRAQERDFTDVMEMTWFCHVPLFDGRPCGFCNPCRYAREEGLGRRVPPRTRSRKVQHTLLSNLTRARKLSRIVSKRISQKKKTANGYGA